MRHPVCRDWFIEYGGSNPATPGRFEGDVPSCALGEVPAPITCPDGAEPLDPWWVGRANGHGGTTWTQASSYQCAADILLALAEQAWDTMPIPPNTYTVQPSTGYAIADLGVVLAIDQAPRTMTTTLLGTNVIIRAVATSYSWSATDGSSWTSGAGARYEHGGSAHPFAPKEQRLSFTLTTTWRGEFSTNGGATWRDAPGTATTTSATTTLHVYHPHNHGTDCTLDGDCASGGAPSGSTRQLLDPDGDGIDNYRIPDHLIAAYLTGRDNGTTWTDAARKSDADIAAQTDGR